MPTFQELITQGASHAWLFIPSALLLGVLHGLEPGHSKTMMAAFIVAIRGTVAQAVLLGVSAAFSHSLVIWLLAATALHFGSRWNAETTEPYFQLASGVMIIALAVWMFLRTRRDQLAAAGHQHDVHTGAPHGGRWIDTGHGLVEVSVFETGVPPRFRLYFYDPSGRPRPASGDTVTLATIRPGGNREVFTFVSAGEHLEATAELPEPHEFEGLLEIRHGDHGHDFPFSFHEHGPHHEGLDVSDGDYQDAHERAHATDIAKRFGDRNVTHGQIVIFGLTGGLLPCPAALTVLLVCLQLKELVLGFTLVLCFSIGLALTMVASGVLAAWGVRHASQRVKGFGSFVRKAPYFSSAILTALGLYIATQGWRHLP